LHAVSQDWRRRRRWWWWRKRDIHSLEEQDCELHTKSIVINSLVFMERR